MIYREYIILFLNVFIGKNFFQLILILMQFINYKYITNKIYTIHLIVYNEVQIKNIIFLINIIIIVLIYYLLKHIIISCGYKQLLGLH